MMKFLKFGMILALIFAGISCEEKTEVPIPQDDNLEMKEVAFTRWEHGKIYDTFRFVLATGATEIDPDQGVLFTKDDGYVMYCNLLTKPVTDITTPIIPDGTYTTGDKLLPRVWYLDTRMSYFVSNNQKDGVKIDNISEGTLTISYSETEYTLKAQFKTVSGETIETQYKGAIQFDGLVDNGTNLVDPVNARFIGGQACYLGADPNFSQLGLVRLELYDAEPDPQLGTVYGNMVKSLLYINKPEGAFTVLDAGTYTVGLGAVAFLAKPGYDDGENIPTGTFIAQTLSQDGPMRMSMIDSGTIEVTKDGYVTIDLKTTEGVSVCGKLKKALEITDLSGQGGGGGEPQEPEGPFSALTTDKVVDLSDVDFGYLYEYGDVYHNNTRNIVIQVLSETTHRGFLLDLALPEAAKGSPLAEGTYKVGDSTNPAYTFAPGRIFGPNAIGTWPYVELYNQDQYTLVDFKTSGNAVDGTLDIKQAGDGYTFTFNLLDDAETPHKITGSWTGKFKDESYTSPFVHGLLK